MTDKERLLAFLNGAGYTRTDEDSPYRMGSARIYYEDGPSEHLLGRNQPLVKNASSIRIGQGIGYTGFLCEFFFDEAGALVNHGVWG